MYHERLITAVTVVLAAIAVLLTVVGLFESLVALPVALAFAAAAYLMYDQLSGRMAARVYRRVEDHARVEDVRGSRRRRTATSDGGRAGRAGRGTRTGGARAERRTGAGPREAWVPPRDGQTAREAAGRRRTRSQRRRRPAGDRPDTSAAEAYRTLDLEPGADEAAIKRAYRAKVKEVHPDTDGGDEAQFKAVTAAYERLTD